VLQIREHERNLRQVKRYVEALQMMDEADALEAFAMEQPRIRWQNEGTAIRETPASYELLAREM
jgi:putative heme iron utilization protein